MRKKRIRIGFVSARLSGTGGVTLESSKWADVLDQNRHHYFWFAAKLGDDGDR